MAQVIKSGMSTAIAASRERVWQALTTPSELIRWDAQIVALLDPVVGYPAVGQRVRWRYHVGSVDIVAHQTIRELRPLERLDSAIALGLFRFDETYRLQTGDERTHLSLSLLASNSLPVVGGSLDRFSVRRMCAELIDSRLRSIRSWCEGH